LFSGTAENDKDITGNFQLKNKQRNAVLEIYCQNFSGKGGAANRLKKQTGLQRQIL
jgi:hypothetical protein